MSPFSLDRLTFNPEIRFRREPFGGILYNPDIGHTIEVNRSTQLFTELVSSGPSASRALLLLSDYFKVDISVLQRDFIPIIDHFITYGVLGNFTRRRNDERSIQNEHVLKMDFPRQVVKNGLNVPEEIHLAITSQCALNCPGCYARSESKLTSRDMATAEIHHLIDVMDAHSIFHLGIGGGEPLLRDDLVEVCKYASQKRITTSVTTSGMNISDRLARGLRDAGIKQIQISHDGNSRSTFEQTRGIGSYSMAKVAIQTLQRNKIPFGFNVLVTPRVLKELQQLVTYAESTGAVELILLRPKPPGEEKMQSWYQENNLTPTHLQTLFDFLTHVDTKLRIRTDTSFSLLYHTLSASELYQQGVFGCSAGRRFCSIRSDGKMYPCSFFFTDSNYASGNCDGLIDNWQNSRTFDSFRSLDEKIDEPCLSCVNLAVCKGCRKIALYETDSFYGFDTGCIKKKRPC